MVLPFVKLFLMSVFAFGATIFGASKLDIPVVDGVLDYVWIVGRFFLIWFEVCMSVPACIYWLTKNLPVNLRHFLLGLVIFTQVWLGLFHLTAYLMVSLVITLVVFSFTSAHAEMIDVADKKKKGKSGTSSSGDSSSSYNELYKIFRRVPGGYSDGSRRSEASFGKKPASREVSPNATPVPVKIDLGSGSASGSTYVPA